MTNWIDDLDRDNLCMALADLFGYSPEDFDGQTFAEIWEYLTDKQQAEVRAYWTGKQAGLKTARKILMD